MKLNNFGKTKLSVIIDKDILNKLNLITKDLGNISYSAAIRISINKYHNKIKT
tara:strand:+ start:218 stop:376 length:159 start_codon:yes stop_codon:yes gene_type:complete